MNAGTRSHALDFVVGSASEQDTVGTAAPCVSGAVGSRIRSESQCQNLKTNMNVEIIAAIDSERDHQDRKYRHRHGPGDYILILRKVLLDAERVWYHNPDMVMHEIRQITAVGVKAMEEHGAPLRTSYIPHRVDAEALVDSDKGSAQK